MRLIPAGSHALLPFLRKQGPRSWPSASNNREDKGVTGRRDCSTWPDVCHGLKSTLGTPVDQLTLADRKRLQGREECRDHQVGDHGVLGPRSSRLPHIDFPQTSPSATLKQRIGLTDIEITYSRPRCPGTPDAAAALIPTAKSGAPAPTARRGSPSARPRRSRARMSTPAPTSSSRFRVLTNGPSSSRRPRSNGERTRTTRRTMSCA